MRPPSSPGDMSSFYRDSSPILGDPAPAPWLARAKDMRRRPLQFRQIVVALAAVVSVLLLATYHLRDSAPAAQSLDIPSPLADSPPADHDVSYRPAFDDAHARIPHGHHNIPSKSTTTLPSEPEPSTLAASLPAPDPVTFALIMFSEGSAAEGAVLIKVRSPSRHYACYN